MPDDRRRKRTLQCIVAIVAIPLSLYIVFVVPHSPSNDRDWIPDQSVTPWADTYSAGTYERVVLHNIRRAPYGELYSTPIYYDKTVRVEEIKSMWYITLPASNMGESHTFLSFGLEDGSFIAVSTEARREKGEYFSSLKGLTRSYELGFVLADEIDIIDRESFERESGIHLYPTTVHEIEAQEIFMAAVRRMNALARKPEFYNPLFNTCSINLVAMIGYGIEVYPSWDPRLMLPANSEKLAISMNLIAPNKTTIKETRRVHRIEPSMIEEFGDTPTLSSKIRTSSEY